MNCTNPFQIWQQLTMISAFQLSSFSIVIFSFSSLLSARSIYIHKNSERRKTEWWEYGRRRNNLRIHSNMGGGCCLRCHCLHFSCCWKNPPFLWQGMFQFFHTYLPFSYTYLCFSVNCLLFLHCVFFFFWWSVSMTLCFSVFEEKESETSLWGLAEDQRRSIH